MGACGSTEVGSNALGGTHTAPAAKNHTYAVEVTVAKAEGLPKMDKTGSIDPYIEITIGGMKQRTTKKKNNQAPVWNEMLQYTFPDNTNAKMMSLKIWDWDLFTKNDLVAEVEVDITEQLDNGREYIWIDLPENNGRVQLVIEGRQFLDDLTKSNWSHVLQITAVGAQNLKTIGRSMGDKVDPYAQFYWGGYRYTTRRIDNNHNPDWNETCYIFVDERTQGDFQLSVNVADHDCHTKDDLIGNLYIPFAELRTHNGKTSEFRLSTKIIDEEQEIENEQNPEAARAKSMSGLFKGTVTLNVQWHDADTVRDVFSRGFLTDYDADDNGKLSAGEILEAFANLGVMDGSTTEADANKWFRSNDADNDGSLTIDEVAGILDRVQFQNAPFMSYILDKYVGTKTKRLMKTFVKEADVRFDSELVVRDRKSGLQVLENIPKKVRIGLSMLYASKSGRWMAEGSLWDKTSQSMSAKKGKKYNKPESAAEIPEFVETYAINMEECICPDPSRPDGGFANFNDFFARSIKPEVRPITGLDGGAVGGRNDVSVIPSGADCRFMCFTDTLLSTELWVKGKSFCLDRVFTAGASEGLADKMEGGPWCIFRLAPQDYHRWHYPVSGRVTKVTPVDGALYTVNPIAVRSVIDVYGDNKRAIIEIENEVLGTVVMVAVGAMMVGAYTLFAENGSRPLEEGDVVGKGEVAGEWRFGGSTVLLFFEKGAGVQWDADLEKNSSEPIETRLYCGERVATVPRLAGANVEPPQEAVAADEEEKGDAGGAAGLANVEPPQQTAAADEEEKGDVPDDLGLTAVPPSQGR